MDPRLNRGQMDLQRGGSVWSCATSMSGRLSPTTLNGYEHMKRITPLLAALLLYRRHVHAQDATDAVISDLQSQGYSHIEIRRSATLLKVEAVKDGVKIEQTSTARAAKCCGPKAVAERSRAQALSREPPIWSAATTARATMSATTTATTAAATRPPTTAPDDSSTATAPATRAAATGRQLGQRRQCRRSGSGDSAGDSATAPTIGQRRQRRRLGQRQRR